MIQIGAGLLAHSAPEPGRTPDPYARHVEAVVRGARERADAMLRYGAEFLPMVLDAIECAAVFHDLGKLDPDIQATLRKARGGKLPWDHIDAGVACLSSAPDWMAAWLVRAHHAPGLPEYVEHFDPDLGRKLRGRRRDDIDRELHLEQIARTDARLSRYVADHESVLSRRPLEKRAALHGLTMRLALSCLVDADHTDTAYFDTGRTPPPAPEPRWEERLAALCRYVSTLPRGETDAERERNSQRAAFFDACLGSSIDAPMVACEGPVGLGKTTAVAAYLLRRAREDGLRRLMVVAPYTNILWQTARRLRKALTLPGEDPRQVVVEHHHRADFESEDARDLAVLWQAPIVLTTAVSFFETLAACTPASLRKLHSVPGSAVFIDEAHGALPTPLWPQNWQWLSQLAHGWRCRFVFASGSLVRFWENGDIIQKPQRLPELLPRTQGDVVLNAERNRVRYARMVDGHVVSVQGLIEVVRATAGPRLVILNTVQTAAVVAEAMRRAGLDVMHLSTALTPRDRSRILKRVVRRLAGARSDWTFVATSCVEAGVDISFRCAFRERFSAASTIQVGGRVNRHGEYSGMGPCLVYDFALAGEGVTQHPGAAVSAEVLRKLMTDDALNRQTPADLVTAAMREELLLSGGLGQDRLTKSERENNYPDVERRGRVIAADTRLVVVNEQLKHRLSQRLRVSSRTLLLGSVQVWATKIEKLGLELLPGRREVYVWNDAYEPDFLGIMAGILKAQQFVEAGGAII